jgi:hypothetical protein
MLGEEVSVPVLGRPPLRSIRRRPAFGQGVVPARPGPFDY